MDMSRKTNQDGAWTAHTKNKNAFYPGSAPLRRERDLRCMCDDKHADGALCRVFETPLRANPRHTKHRNPMRQILAGLSLQRMGWHVFAKHLTPPSTSVLLVAPLQ